MKRFPLCKLLVLSCTIFLILIVEPVSICGQSADSNLEGRTMGIDDKPLGGITITALNRATGLAKSAVSSADGSYRLFGLPPGNYDVAASISNTTFEVKKNVQLTVGQSSTISFRIDIQLNEKVTITTQSPIIQTTQSKVDHVVSQREIDNLPINGRTFQQLAVISPGVTTARQIDPTKKHNGAISIEGSGGRRVNSRVDGADNNDDVVGSFLQQYSQEAIQEFVVTTELFKAEDGFATEGLVNAVVRSGSNRFSGNAFFFLRDTALNSRTFFEESLGLKKPDFQRKQWGGVISGPITRNTVHFFASYERQDQLESTVFNTGNVFPQLNTTIPLPFDQDLFLARVTGSISPLQTFSVRFAIDDETESGTGADGRHAPEATGLTRNQFWSGVFHHDWSIGNNKLNQFLFHAGIYRNQITPTVPENNFTVRTPTADFFRWTSASQSTKQNKYQFADDFSMQVPDKKGDHLFKVGGEYMYEPIAGGELEFFQNLFVYNTDNAIVVINGRPQARPFSEVRPVSYLGFSGKGIFGQPLHWFSLYAQDDWRLNHRLTLNLGVRYELQTGIWREHNVPGENRLRESGLQGPGPHDDKNNVAWRFGFAYQPSKDGRTVIRGGSGRFYDRVLVVSAFMGQFFETSPRFLAIQIANPTFGPLNIPAGFSEVNPASPSVRQETVDAGNKNSYSDQWSIGFARDLGRGVVLDASYLHTSLKNLVMYLNINYRGPGGRRVLFPDLGDFGHVSTIGSGTYDGLKVRVQRRFADRLQFQGSYVLSRRNSIPDVISPVPLNQADPLNNDEFGPTDNHETHRFVLSWISKLFLGFQLSGIVQAASARPYTARVSGDINGDGVTGDRVEPYNARRGSSTFTLDMRLTKFFYFRNERRCELIFEAFNITNRANFGQFFVGNVNSPNFGRPSGQLLTGPRQAQVGIRMTF